MCVTNHSTSPQVGSCGMLHDIIKTIQQQLADGVDTTVVGVDTLRTTERGRLPSER